jgi:hypothetical protein
MFHERITGQNLELITNLSPLVFFDTVAYKVTKIIDCVIISSGGY